MILCIVNKMVQCVQFASGCQHFYHRFTVTSSPTAFMYDRNGNRKYLTVAEREAFLAAADDASPEVMTFCRVLAYTGARISEALALTPDRFDAEAQVVVIRSLKKRRPDTFRPLPLPAAFLEQLEAVHSITLARMDRTRARLPIWSWGRTMAWKHVKKVMADARIEGPHACPRGLRHCFGVAAVQSGVPLNVVQKWLGHSRMATTAIYTDVVGAEEQALAKRFWKTFNQHWAQ